MVDRARMVFLRVERNLSDLKPIDQRAIGNARLMLRAAAYQVMRRKSAQSRKPVDAVFIRGGYGVLVIG